MKTGQTPTSLIFLLETHPCTRHLAERLRTSDRGIVGYPIIRGTFSQGGWMGRVNPMEVSKEKQGR
jgi:hypothetical protein